METNGQDPLQHLSSLLQHTSLEVRSVARYPRCIHATARGLCF